LTEASLRVLLVANTLPPRDLSGVGEQVLQLAEGLRERGCEVEIRGRSRSGLAASKLLFPVMVIPGLIRDLRRFRPHVVQVHESDGALAALVTVILRGVVIPKTRVVSLLQVSYVEERRAVRPLVDGERVLGVPGAVERRFRLFKAPLQIVLGRLTAWLSDLVLCPSWKTVSEVEHDYGVSGASVVPNVTGGLPVAAAEELSAEVSGEPYVLFVGRIRVRKGIEVLLHAMAEESDSVRLLLAGDGEHREAVEATAAELGITDRAVFLGRQSAGQVRSLLAGARALIVPSTYEGMPLVILEAMEAGVPVVASAVSGIPEVVVDGETGWLVPQEDVQSLGRALNEVWQDAAERERRGRAGRERVEDRYRPDNGAEIWLERIGDQGETRT